MPFTLRRSSGVANGALARCSTMACAFDGPMPGRVDSSSDEAALMSTRDPGAASTAPATPPRSTSPQRNPAATFLRFVIVVLLPGASAGAVPGLIATRVPVASARNGAENRARSALLAAFTATLRRRSRRQLSFPERLCYSPEPHVGGHLHGV